MLVDIQALFLDTLANTQTVNLLNAVEQYYTTGSSPEVDNQNTEQLSTEETETVTVESTV